MVSAKHPVRFVLSRITNTAAGNAVNLVPQFQQVLVQARKPVPGQTYNVFSVAVRNHTSWTFTAQGPLLCATLRPILFDPGPHGR